MKYAKPRRKISCQVLILLLVVFFVPAKTLHSQPYHYAQVLPGIDKHHMMINNVTKDPFGMVWMISGGLIYRFDGVSVNTFSKLYNKALPFYEANDLYADPWGRLWINTRNGLVLFDLTTWSFIDSNHPLGALIGRQVVSCFNTKGKFYLADGDGSVWSIDQDEKRLLFRFDANVVYERRPVGRVLVADDDWLWLAFGDYLYGYGFVTHKQTVAPFSSGLFSSMEDMLPVEGGVLIRIHSQGYYVFDGSNFRFLLRENFRTNDFTNWNHWSFETDDKIVVFHEDRYFEFSRDTAFRLLTTGSNQLGGHILYNRINGWQRGGDEWLLCTERGLYSVFPAKISFDFVNCGSARGMIRQGSTYYFGGYGYLDLLSEDGHLHADRHGPENNYYAFLALSADTAYIALEGDFLGYLIGGKVSPAPVHVPSAAKEQFTGMAYCLARYSADTLLVGTYNGIWKYARSSGNVYPLICPEAGFFSRGMRVQSMSITGNNVKFTTDEGYFEWAKQQFHKRYPANSTKLNIYSHVQHGDSVYLATRGQGLIILDSFGRASKTINYEDGLASKTVYQLALVDDALFMGTHEGLSVLKAGKLYNYYHSDGLPFEEFNHQAIYHDAEHDRLFMGGVGGYIHFEPTQLLQSVDAKIPNPRLSAIRLGMKSNRHIERYGQDELKDSIQLPADAVWFSMNFAHPNSYRQVYRMQFKIVPLMDEFQDMPASAQINLSGMSAGNYHVTVKLQAINNGESETTHTWVINKKPLFTETLLFYIILIFVVGGTTGFILFERARKEKGERQLRRSISRDLHDEVGSMLTGISMQTDLLRLKKEYATSGTVESIGSYSREAIQMMDDIIWAVDTRNNQQASLTDRMKLLAVQLLEPKEIRIMFDIDQQEGRKISQTVRQNLYLIYKEAIHNICKHSDATTVYVKLSHSGKQIDLVVRDDGLRREEPAGNVVRKGYGQRNMKLRAAQIGGIFESKRMETGYEISVIVKLFHGRFWLKLLTIFRD